MEMSFGLLLVAWSIRLSMVLLVLTLLVRLLAGEKIASSLGVKCLWTTSFALFVLHVLASFHYVHHWSHAEAHAATAEQTRELMGLEFGAGVYFNYLFMLTWAYDLWCVWQPPTKLQTVRRWLQRISLVYMLFIAFNGVIIFKSGWLRWAGMAATACLVIAVAVKVYVNNPQPSPAARH